MIETQYHILSEKIHEQVIIEANKLGVSVDYFLMEFCSIQERGTTN